MIAVEIPAALATDPQVVPVDPCPHARTTKPAYNGGNYGNYGTRRCLACGATRDDWTGWQLGPTHLVDQRVALAWRETCPTALMTSSGNYGDPVIERQIGGERMVVGWTAEVEAVVPIRSAHPVSHRVAGYVLALPDGSAQDWTAAKGLPLPPADWSPGRYALVLRDARRWMQQLAAGEPGYVDTSEQCLPFDGFAELDEVLA